MASDKIDQEPATPPPPAPSIVLVFGGVASAEITMRAEHVTPGQLYLAAWYLDQVAREVRAGQVQQTAMGSLVQAAGLSPEAIQAAMDSLRGN